MKHPELVEMDKVKAEAAEILRDLMYTHSFLQPASPAFGIFNKYDAIDMVDHLIEKIKAAREIEFAHHQCDWGK